MFITFEGMEGCGKTTQMEKLEKWLLWQGWETVRTREPGGSKLGQQIRQILLHPENSELVPMGELFLYLADRAQHVASFIRPALAQKKIVLCDRFADSTIVYQGYGRGLDTKMLLNLNEQAVCGLWPDLTLLLDLEPEIGLRRALSRDLVTDKHRTEGRFEMEEIDFHRRIREGYLTWAALNHKRFVVIDAGLSEKEVFSRICSVLTEFLGSKKGGA